MRILLTLLLTISLIPTIITPASLKDDTRPVRYQKKSVQIDLPGTIDGAINPSSIPDNIAYELFLGALGRSSSRKLAERVGLEDKKVDALLSEGRSFEGIITELEEIIRRNSSELKPNQQVEARLRNLQQQRELYLAKVKGLFLPRKLGDADTMKLQTYIRDKIKRKIKKIPVAAIRRVAVLGPTDTQDKDSSVYLYTDSWYENATVYGVGAVAADYIKLGEIGYEVTTTITAPDGIRYSAGSGGGSVAVVNVHGLPIEKDDGRYTVESVFEAETPFGSYYVSGSVAFEEVAGTVTLSDAAFIPTTIAGRNDVAELKVAVRTTTSVPKGATATVEVTESSNFNGVDYEVSPGRLQTVTLEGLGLSTTAIFKFKTSPTNQNGGTIKSTVTLIAVGGAERGKPDEISGLTLTVNAPSQDDDGDGYSPPDDCDDTDPGINPGVTIPTSNCQEIAIGTDRNCNGIDDAQECTGSPIIVGFSGEIRLTSPADGVDFDLNGDGIRERLSWTRANSETAWLALDRNGNGYIDNGRELFGNFSPQPASANPNGFLALAEFDKRENGGNGDGVIDSRDAIYSSLRLWRDANHNGISESGELRTLQSLGVEALDLDYKESRRRDRYGNLFRHRAKVYGTNRAHVGWYAWDVFFAPLR